MGYKRKKVDVREEAELITGMIISDRFLGEIRSLLDLEDLVSDFSKVVGGWCLDFYEKYEEAPKASIETIFEAHEESLEDSTYDLIADFLETLNDQHTKSKFNIEYALDQSIVYLNRRSILRLAAESRNAAKDGQVSKALEILEEHTPLQRTKVMGFDPFHDQVLIREAFESHAKPLMKFGGAFGEFINAELVRDGFIGLLGPEKRGKTFHLINFIMRGWRDGLNVAGFELGDMSELQFTRRMNIYNSSRSDRPAHCGKYLKPTYDCKLNQNDECDFPNRTCDCGIIKEEGNPEKHIQPVFMTYKEGDEIGYEPCDYCRRSDPSEYEGATWFKIVEKVPLLTYTSAFERNAVLQKRFQAGRLKMAAYPSKSINIAGIEQQLALWEEEDGFVADLIVLDYADLLDSEPGVKEFRHQQNSNWMAMRAMSQRHHALVITATQADANSYTQKNLNLTNFSEDKRKFAHVTAMYGLNQTMQEKALQMQRISKLLVREDSFTNKDQVHIMSCLNQGRIITGSYF